MSTRLRLVEQINRLPYEEIPLSPSEADRAKELHERLAIVDLHAHPIVLPENLEELLEYSTSLDYPLGFDGLLHSGLTACFSANIDFKGLLSGNAWHWDDAVQEVGNMRSQVYLNEAKAIPALRVLDVKRAKEERKVAIFLALENGGDAVGNHLQLINVLHGIGVRCMGLTYTKRNLMGDGQFERTDAGLSDMGYAVVERMGKLGILLDLSHVGTQTTLDAIGASKRPTLITHAGARSLYSSRRMKTDEEIHALSEKGGVFGVEAAPNALSGNSEQGVKDVLDHIDYLVKLVGSDHVGLGTDTLFGDHGGLHNAILDKLGVSRPEDAKHADYMKGIESASEWPNITRGLVSRGYSDSEIAKILGENAIRVMTEVLG